MVGLQELVSIMPLSRKELDEMKQKDFRNILNCESAVSEIIAAIMLLAIAVGMIAIIQSQSVPEWNKAIEMDHYNVVYDDFLKIRSDIEDVAVSQFPKSSVIHMGVHYPERMIFINPADTSGTITSDYVWINVSYTNSTGNDTYNNFSSTSIRFDPNYNYYSNAASIVYEHGLVIKDFTDNNYIYTDTDQDIISGNTINILNLSYPLESVSFSDIKTMNYNPESIYSEENITNVNVTFYTNYPLLWKELFKKYNFKYNDGPDPNILEFNFSYPDNITIKAYTINGSISSGTGVSVISVLTTITVSPPTALVVVTNTATFTAAPKDQNGNAMTATVTWNSSNTTVGTINTAGVFTALATGTTTITATSGIVSGTATATVVSEFTYVSNIFDLLNIDNVLDISAARNASDGGASAVFNESLIGNTPDLHNYTYVTSNITINGTIANFSNMQNSTDAGAFANLTEGQALTNQSNRIMNPTKQITTGNQSGTYNQSNLTSIDGAIDITTPGVS